MTRLCSLRFLWLALLLALSMPTLFAQDESGAITGSVTDPSGAVVAHATVTIVDLGTNTTRATQTGANGEYSFSTLRPSHYKITVTAPGFKESLVASIELHTQEKIAENVTLSLGASSDTVNVNGDSTQLETTAAVATTIEREFIENMPLNGRSFQALIALTPGNVTAKTYYTHRASSALTASARTPITSRSMASAPTWASRKAAMYTSAPLALALPAATSNNGGYNNLVSVDDMQEFNIQTNSFDAEYGRSPGAALSIITRSGTNRFHGTAFEYVRNDI